MIDQIRVSNVGVLKSATLAALGRINVISGPNNSGKSTLLQGLADPHKRGRGLRFDVAVADEIFDLAVKHTGWSGNPTAVQENRAYRSLIRGILGGRVWYEDDHELLMREFESQVANNALLSRWSMNPGVVVHQVKQRFGEFPDLVLLPPKRHLDLFDSISTGERVQPNGSGLLNYLFFSKNQPLGSADRRIYDHIRATFTSISAGYNFDVFAKADNKIALQFARAKGPWIAAEQCGLGLQDLLVILYFAIETKYQVLLIEEPESHLHPDLQRRLLVSMRNDTAKQYFLSTHSNIFLNNALIDRVFSTRFDGEIRVSDETVRASLLDDLGYSVADNLVSDLVVLVEGPSDVAVLEELFVKRGFYRTYEIKIWPLGGDIMDQIDLSIMSERYNVIALIDRDPKSVRVRKRFQRRCSALSIPVQRLKRYSIENYFSVAALRVVMGGQVPPGLSVIDPSVKLEDQIGLNVKNNNRRIARAMSLNDIAGTDLETFLDFVEKLCREGKSPRSVALP